MTPVILMPRSRPLEWETVELIRDIDGRGWPLISEAWSPHDRARGRHLALALQAGADVAVWLDDDTVATVEQIDALLDSTGAHDLVTGVYCCRHMAERGRLGLSFNARDRAQSLAIQAPGGLICIGSRQVEPGLVSIAACGLGFAAMRLSGLRALDNWTHPVSYDDAPGRDWFAALVEGGEHLGEDRSFCVRAARAGWDMVADTRIVVGHRGGRTWFPWNVGG